MKLPSHLIVAISSWLSKAIIAGVQIVSVRLLISILGEDQYAIFSLLSALLIWCSISDFGVGSSLQNFISECRAKEEKYNDYLKTGIAISFASCFVFAFIYILASGSISGFYLQSFSIIDQYTKQTLFAQACVIFIFIGVGSVSYKILFSELIGWKANVFNAVSYLAGFLVILFFYFNGYKIKINQALLALYGPIGFISFSYLGYRFFLVRKSKISFRIVKDILRRARGFFLFGFLSILVLQADYIVISQKLSPREIVMYTVLMKVFGLVFFIYSAVLQALWPLCAEYTVKGEWRKLYKLIYKNIICGIVFVCVSTLCIYMFRNEIFTLLIKDIDYSFSFSIFLIMALYFSIRVWTDTFAMILQSVNYLRPLWILVPAQAVLCLSIQWVLASSWGIQGVLLGLLLSFVLTVSWGLPLTYKLRVARD